MPSQRRCKKPRHWHPRCSRHHLGPARQRPGRPRQAQRAVPADLGVVELDRGKGLAGYIPGAPQEEPP
eukprot:1089915-Pyramimonas_sp.AAC.1